MQLVERDILVEDNPAEGVWYIPVTFMDPEDYTYVGVEGYTLDISAAKISVSDNTVTQSRLDSDTCNDWLVPSTNASFYTLCVPSSVAFTQYLTVYINLLDGSNDLVALPIIINIRKVALSSSGSGSGSSSSISVPTAPEIAAAVWNYGAEEGDDPITDRTLSTTVEVNPSAIAQAVWNYADANPASGTLGTRTLTTAIPTASDIASAVLTTDVSAKTVGENGYTIKHLIMASQRSIVVTEGNETKWKIMSNQTDAETGEEIVIATRTLTLNGNGAITQTE